MAVLGQLVPMWATGDVPVDNSVVAIGEAILALGSALGGSAGLLVVLEDLHWADDETLAVIEYVADNIGDSAFGMVLTMRSAPIAASALARTLASRGSVRHLALEVLSDAEATEMVQRCLGEANRAIPDEVVEDIALRAAGLPLLIEDLLASQVSRSPVGPGIGSVPERFADTVRQRLAGLSEQSRQVVVAGAVLGPRFDWRFLEAITRLSAVEVGEAIKAVVDAQIFVVEPVSGETVFRHALIRDVVLADLDPVSMRTTQHGAADAVAARSAVGGDRDVLRPLEAGLRAGAGDVGRAVDLLIELTESDVSRGALRSAEKHVLAALDLDPIHPQAAHLLLDVLLHSGQVERALVHGRIVLDRPTLTVRQRTAALVLVARAALAAHQLREAHRHLDSARPTATAAEVAEIASLEAQVALATIDERRVVAAEHLAHRAVAAAEMAGVPEMVCESLEVVGRCARLRDLDAAQEAFARALAVAEAHGLALWRIRALNELGTVDMFRDADPARLLDARRAAESAGALATVAGIDVNLAALHTMRGEYALARTAAESCERTARRCRVDGLIAAALVFHGVIAAHEGRFADMRRHVRNAEDLAGDDPDVIVGTWAMCRGTAALLQEERDEACAAFSRAAMAIAGRPPLAISPVEGPWLLLRMAIGDAAVVDVDAYASRQARGSLWSALWEGAARGIALGAIGDNPSAEAAVATTARAGQQLPLFTAIALRLVGERAIADRWGRPAEWLQQAEETFGAAGHDRAARACRDLLRRTGARVPRPRQVDAVVPSILRAHGITAREYEVLQLVAERHSNAEIADRLFLSPRTVEKHVASLLWKSGVTDRKALAALL